ncbi:MAG: antirestriction protein ArdC [Robiginitomaculum sp.]|nr:MAG: antirestriction protein ArdC [Robiginitomaculum sp.]
MTDLYQSVTDTVIAQLEAGCVPWVQPWARVGEMSGTKTPMGLPTNGHTSRQYSGINILLLWGAAIDTKRTTQTWLTYKQALELGGNVRAGESGTTVCYASTFTPKAEKERAATNGLEPQSIGFLKRYTVFNADQCEGLSDEFYKDVEPLPDCEIIPIAENLINATGADFRIGGDKAFYMPSKDLIQVPPQPAFFKQINYYRTCFHELGHWTGHTSRLDRDQKGNKGTKLYAREELVAEMTSAFICAHLGIQPTVRHTDYLGSWLRLLKDDKRAIFKAASQASKSANFILECLNTPPDEPTPQQVQAPVKRQLEVAA